MVVLPWYIVRFRLFGVPVTLLECVAIFTIAVWGLNQAIHLYQTGLFASIAQLIRWARQSWLVILPVGLFLIAATFAVLISPNLTAALGIYKAYIIEPVLLAIVVWSTVDRERDLRLVVGSMLIAAAQVSLLAISQYVWGWPNFAPDELSQGRSSAMYNTANAVGLFVGPLTLLATSIAIGWWHKSRLISGGLGLIACLGCSAIVLSRSDGAMVAILGSILFASTLLVAKRFGWLQGQIWVRVAGAGGLVYMIVTIIFMLWFNHPPQVTNPYTRPGFSTFTVRQCTWQGTINLLAERPITGSGLANFSTSYVKHATCDAEPLVYPHNFILNFWTETGLLGLLSIMGIAIGWLYVSGKLVLCSGRYTWLGLGLCLSLVYWLIHGLVDVPYFKNDLSIAWWVLFSITLLAKVKLQASIVPARA